MRLFLFFSCFSYFVHSSCFITKAAIDVGSGSTKMKVYNFDSCEQRIISEKTQCAASDRVSYKDSLKVNGFINNDVIDKGKRVLSTLKEIALLCGADKIAAVATSAFRVADNGQEIVNQLSESGVPVKIISHYEEAMLGFYGAIAVLEQAPKDLCVWDIGGSSMQIVCRENDEFFIHLGKIASVSFKHMILEVQQRSDFFSPNPISQNDYSESQRSLIDYIEKVPSEVALRLSYLPVFGIGGVHYFSVASQLEHKHYSVIELNRFIKQSLGETDNDFGLSPFVDTNLSNPILVETFAKGLGIQNIHALRVNLTQGLVTSPEYW